MDKTEMVFAVNDKKSGRIVEPTTFERKTMTVLAKGCGAEIKMIPVWTGWYGLRSRYAHAFVIVGDKKRVEETFSVIKEVLLVSPKRETNEYKPLQNGDSDFEKALQKFCLPQKVRFYDWHNVENDDGYCTTGVGLFFKKQDDYDLANPDTTMNVEALSKLVLKRPAIFTGETVQESIWVR